MARAFRQAHLAVRPSAEDAMSRTGHGVLPLDVYEGIVPLLLPCHSSGGPRTPFNPRGPMP
jgi:hypothetical protein